jgi:hypothetical protein
MKACQELYIYQCHPMLPSLLALRNVSRLPFISGSDPALVTLPQPTHLLPLYFLPLCPAISLLCDFYWRHYWSLLYYLFFGFDLKGWQVSDSFHPMVISAPLFPIAIYAPPCPVHLTS